MSDAAISRNGPLPVAVGYVRAHLLMTDAELADTKRDMADCAQRQGYAMGAVHVERIDDSPAAFGELVNDVMRYGATAVIMPSVHHLAVLGPPDSLRHHLEDTTGVRVLFLRHCP